MKQIQFLILIGISILFSSCSGGLIDFIPLSVDTNLGMMNKEQIESNNLMFKLLDEEKYPEPYIKLNEIKDKILETGKVKHAEDFPWELKIIEDDSILNAFCLPGGYIYVYTGLIKYLDSEDELAGVLGHEIAHADLRHSANQMVKNSGISLALSLIFGVDHSTLVSLGANLLSLSFSRYDEREADMQSVEYLYNTDLDARGVSRFFEKIQEDDKDPGMVEFISTHPNPENRVHQIQEKWKELGAKKGKTYKQEYLQLKKHLP